MLFKNESAEKGWKNPDIKLSNVVKYAEGFIRARYNKPLIATGTFRTHKKSIQIYTGSINPKTGKLYLPKEVPVSTHETTPLRAVDLRAGSVHPDGLNELEAADLVTDINATFIYDTHRPTKKVAMLHAVTGGALHLHLQVHPSTRMREEM